VVPTLASLWFHLTPYQVFSNMLTLKVLLLFTLASTALTNTLNAKDRKQGPATTNFNDCLAKLKKCRQEKEAGLKQECVTEAKTNYGSGCAPAVRGLFNGHLIKNRFEVNGGEDECRRLCNREPRCQYWNYGVKSLDSADTDYCYLRSHQGSLVTEGTGSTIVGAQRTI